jgi:predicted MPP superfamily phosphohydrolase
VGQSKLYVTRGLGEVNIPLRVLCPPEIALLVLNGSRS